MEQDHKTDHKTEAEKCKRHEKMEFNLKRKWKSKQVKLLI